MEDSRWQPFATVAGPETRVGAAFLRFAGSVISWKELNMPFHTPDAASHELLLRLEAERRDRRLQMRVRLEGGLAPRSQTHPLLAGLARRLHRARTTPVIRGERPLTPPVIHTGGIQL